MASEPVSAISSRCPVARSSTRTSWTSPERAVQASRAPSGDQDGARVLRLGVQDSIARGDDVEDVQLGDGPPGPEEGEARPVRGPPRVRVDPGAAPELHRRARRDVHDVQAAPLALVERDRQPRPVGRPGVVDGAAAREDADRAAGEGHAARGRTRRGRSTGAGSGRPCLRPARRPDRHAPASPRAPGSGPRPCRDPGPRGRRCTGPRRRASRPATGRGRCRTRTGSGRPPGGSRARTGRSPAPGRPPRASTREPGSARPATSTLRAAERERVRGVGGLQDDGRRGRHRLHVDRRVGGRGLAALVSRRVHGDHGVAIRPVRATRVDPRGSGRGADPRPVAEHDVARDVGLGARVPGQVHVADDRRRHEARGRAGGIDVPDRGLDRARFALGPVAVDRRDRVDVAAIGDTVVVEGQDARPAPRRAPRPRPRRARPGTRAPHGSRSSGRARAAGARP